MTFRKRRLYPFDGPVSTATNTNPVEVKWTMTTYKPNPFHGVDRVAFAVDEWAHRRGLVMTNHTPWGLWRRPSEGEWVWDWFDDSPRGETYGVRRADEVLCYTNRFKAGFDDAQRIAICNEHLPAAWTADDGSPSSRTREKVTGPNE